VWACQMTVPNIHEALHALGIARPPQQRAPIQYRV
jgi:hypothetical protein